MHGDYRINSNIFRRMEHVALLENVRNSHKNFDWKSGKEETKWKTRVGGRMWIGFIWLRDKWRGAFK
jgi:hypothetical protein